MNKKMILHYGNIAGWPYYYARGLRNLGYDSISIKPQYEESTGYGKGIILKRELPSDISVYHENENKLVKIAKLSSTFLKYARKIGVVHYYSQSILPLRMDARIFKMMGIPMVISWAGGDARIVELARKNNPYFYREFNREWDNGVRKRLKSLSKYIKVVATDPEMAEYSRLYFDNVCILRQPIDISCYEYHAPVSGRKPILLHIPTLSSAKGTEHIVNAVEKLRAEKVEFEFKLLEAKYTQDQMREIIAGVDVYVDELRCGSYGQTAVEAMALGKPTLTYIREDLVEKYPSDLPIINANPDTIYNKLKDIILDTTKRNELSGCSRAYVEKYHALEEVSKDLLNIYKKCGYVNE
jgi:glycosyltransferase involved in cell wall biosynthesis